MSDKSVAVIGGGFSGLVCAYYLAKKGFKVDLYEAKERLGGVVGTIQTPHGLVEKAARGVMVTPRVEALFNDVGVPIVSLKGTSKKKFIYRNGPKTWPLKPTETLKFIFGICRGLLFRKRFLPQRNESLTRWVTSRISQATLKYLVDPALQGIYSGDPNRLSARLILGPFFSRKKRKGSSKYKGTISPPEGMEQLIKGLGQKLAKLGVQIHLNSPVQAKDLTHKLKFICVDGKEAGRQIEPLAKTTDQSCFAAALTKIELLPLDTVTLFFPPKEGSLIGLGCLFAEDQGAHSLGVIFNEYVFPNRAKGHSETWILGGARASETFKDSDKELIEKVILDRERLYERKSSAYDSVVVQRWPSVMPHYTVEWADVIDRQALPEGVFLCGNYLGGIGLSKILERAAGLVGGLNSSGDVDEKS